MLQVLHGRGESFSPVGRGSGPDGGHNDHFHVEFHKGGEVKGVKRDTPHLGLKKGERWGKFQEGETWIDIDSGEYKPVKNMLLAINQASGSDGVMKAIRDYAPYESRQSRMIPFPVERPVPVPVPMGSSGGGGTVVIGDGQDPFKGLASIG